MEQQRQAYRDLRLHELTPEAFKLQMAPYRPKVPPQFPPPEALYDKEFAFLAVAATEIAPAHRIGQQVQNGPQPKAAEHKASISAQEDDSLKDDKPVDKKRTCVDRYFE